MGISTHVLDTAIGRPAVGVAITLERMNGDSWSETVGGVTNSDGRLGGLVSDDDLATGTYRITFATGAYFSDRGETSFYPEVTIDFTVHDATEHHHVPLLVSPWSYSTYRGS